MPSSLCWTKICRAIANLLLTESVELVLLPQFVALAFCGRLLELHQKHAAYFNPRHDWPQPIAMNANFSITLQKLAFLGDTRSRRELLVFAEANPSRLPLAMGIAQAGIPVRPMASDRKTKLTDTLVRLLQRFLTPASISSMDSQHDQYFRDSLLEPAAHGDGQICLLSLQHFYWPSSWVDPICALQESSAQARPGL